jgi:hypothetical protein
MVVTTENSVQVTRKLPSGATPMRGLPREEIGATKDVFRER